MEHLVAERLSMTVDHLRVVMSNDEFVRWSIYFARKGQRRQLGQ